ncbi:hypothetical protein COOONC_00019 [Cooperia oncophora]
MRKQTNGGVKYNAVLLDVCYNVPRAMMCPIEEFLSDDVIDAMKAITSSNGRAFKVFTPLSVLRSIGALVINSNNLGAVIVNIITSRDRTDEADRLNFLFSRHFPSCYLMADGKVDRMLFCSAKENNSWLNNRDELYNRYVAVDAALGFKLVLRKKFVPNDLM